MPRFADQDPTAPERAHAVPRVAIIGGGTAGMGAARRLLQSGAAVTLLESTPRLGGNCLGVDVPLPGGGVCRIDAGVSDFNVDTFVRVRSLLDELGMRYAPICQDASFMTPDGEAPLFVRDGKLHAASVNAQMDAERIAAEAARFNVECVEVLEGTRFQGWTLDRYLRARSFSDELAELYLYPRAIGCFSMPDAHPGGFCIQALVRFWKMHGLVGGRGPARRMSVVGGMHTYCVALQEHLSRLGADIRCGVRVIGVSRRGPGIEIRATTSDDEHVVFRVDHVIFATPPHAIVPLLEDASAAETAAFAQLPVQRARLVVHTDPRLLPRDPKTWGAYNYAIPRGASPGVRPTITFFPNRILGLPTSIPDVFVTMNPATEPDPARVVTQRFFVHPVANARTRRLTARIDRLQGRRNTWFCGSYLREPFLHEQAHATGEDVAHRLIRVQRELDGIPARRRRSTGHAAGHAIPCTRCACAPA